MDYLVVYEHGPSGCGAFIPDLPGCVAVGADEDEARRLIAKAAREHVAALKREGRAVPPPLCRAESLAVGG